MADATMSSSLTTGTPNESFVGFIHPHRDPDFHSEKADTMSSAAVLTDPLETKSPMSPSGTTSTASTIRRQVRVQVPGPGRRHVAQISEMKKEPGWMRDFRLKSLEQFERMPMPTGAATCRN